MKKEKEFSYKIKELEKLNLELENCKTKHNDLKMNVEEMKEKIIKIEQEIPVDNILSDIQNKIHCFEKGKLILLKSLFKIGHLFPMHLSNSR